MPFNIFEMLYSVYGTPRMSIDNLVAKKKLLLNDKTNNMAKLQIQIRPLENVPNLGSHSLCCTNSYDIAITITKLLDTPSSSKTV